MKSIALAILLTVTTVSTLWAQALPFTKRPVTQEEFAVAIEKCDRSVLNSTNSDCDLMVAAANQAFGLQFADRADLASYVRRLTVADCTPGVESSFARVLSNGAIDLYGYARECRPGEQWLFDNQGAHWFASLLCGNYVTRKGLPVMRTETVATRLTEPAPPAAASTTPIQNAVDNVVRNELQREARPLQNTVRIERSRRSWLGRNWKWVVPVATAAVVGAACTIPEPHCFNVTQTVIVDLSGKR